MAVNAKWLESQVSKRRAMPFKFAGHLMVLDGRHGVYWPEQDLLIVSDLHLEKGSYLGCYANPIPHYDSRKTLALLSALVVDYQPANVICLGDTFHDEAAFDRMPQTEREALFGLLEQAEKWIWILGNHDPVLPAELGHHQTTQWGVGDIVFVHEPTQTTSVQMIGHFHPKATTRQRRLRVRGRCLVHNDKILIMPAFGQYTGGLDIQDEAISTLFDMRKPSGFVINDGRLMPFNHASVS